MKIVALPEGLFTVDRSKVFIPFDPQTDSLAARPPKSVVLGVQPFLVCLQDEFILLDTGLGFQQNGTLQLFAALEKEGVYPGQITKVILSHLHKDHTGGVGQLAADGSYRFNFPNATYYIQERELAFARSKSTNPSYHPETLAALSRHAQVAFLKEDAGSITRQITYSVSGGHTPYHQTVLIRDKGQAAFFGGDELPLRAYLQHNFAYKTDYNGKQGMEWRKKWMQQGAAENWSFLLYHEQQQPLFGGTAI